MLMARILITGSLGQIGTELAPYLRKTHGKENVIATDIKKPNNYEEIEPFYYVDVLDYNNLERIVIEHDIQWVVHNAAILSAVGEKNPQLALKINTEGVKNVLELARKHGLRVYSPSSIAAFGPSTPKDYTPDITIMRPTTMYGITKVFLELLGEYYKLKFGVDFRSLRYPGIISSKALPGGGTTDYAVEIFYKAIEEKHYVSFLDKDTMLPMMYMPDCLKATSMLLEAPEEKLSQRVYNVTAFSFTPEQLAEEIRKHIPEFTIEYKPDYRQEIAETWPRTINDEKARKDWGWEPDYTLERMVEDMLEAIRKKLEK